MAKHTIKRRVFLGTGFLGLGGLLGWLGHKTSAPAPPIISQKKHRLAAKPAINLKEYQAIDPKLMHYEFNSSFPTGMDITKRLAVDLSTGEDGSIYVIGDKKLKTFGPNGESLINLDFDQEPLCIHIHKEQILIGFINYFIVLNTDGKLQFQSPNMGERTFLTSITVSEDRIFLADAGNREIIVCDLQGKPAHRFGKKSEQNPGFVVPSPYFDISLSSQGYLLVSNPGRLRVETYSLDGQYQSSWGEAGMKPGEFCGCCNPVYFDITNNGEFITSEKGLSRISIFNPDGTLKGIIAGHAELIQDEVKAKQARRHFQKGICFDVAVGNQNRMYIVDPVMNEIRIFDPKQR